eukprot:5567912-Pleurochrysis_carterae.AAC.1
MMTFSATLCESAKESWFARSRRESGTAMRYLVLLICSCRVDAVVRTVLASRRHSMRVRIP